MKKTRLYPPIKPYDKGMLDVGHGHKIYWEVCGNPKGKPAVFLHGGPGGGFQDKHRQLFNPKKYKIILFDQRGCGRSTPHHCLTHNTTWDLVDDMERLRKLHNVKKWVVLGGSWGSTLALAYSEKYPNYVDGLILRGIFTLRKKELDWFYQEGASSIFPEEWDKFIAILSPAERKHIMQSYAKRLASKNEKIQLEAARAWTRWEMRCLRLIPEPPAKPSKKEDQFSLAFACIENHFFMNGGFMKEGQLIRDAKKLQGIRGIIIQGRYDIVCPPVTAWELHKAWRGSKLQIMPMAGHAFSEQGTLEATIKATDAFAG